MRFLFPAGLVCAAAGIVAAVPSGGYSAPYFGATRPGAWSRYSMTSDGKTESEYLYERLPDVDGSAQVELRVDFTKGQFSGTWSSTRYVLSRRFRLEDDAISFGKHCERLFSEANTMKLQEMAASTLPFIVDAAIDYAASVKFAGTEKVEGRACDHYTYHYVSPGRNSTEYTGDLWMNASVPFGMVKEAATLKDADGKRTSSYSMTLLSTGVDTSPVPPLPIAAGARAKREKATLAEAYRKGELECAVRVDPDSKDGARLFLVATNKSEGSLRLTLRPGASSLEAGAPVGMLQIRIRKARVFDLAPGQSTPEFSVAQEGERRPVEGKFTISIYEGTPLFSGSVTIGTAGR